MKYSYVKPQKIAFLIIALLIMTTVFQITHQQDEIHFIDYNNHENLSNNIINSSLIYKINNETNNATNSFNMNSNNFNTTTIGKNYKIKSNTVKKIYEKSTQQQNPTSLSPLLLSSGPGGISSKLNNQPIIWKTGLDNNNNNMNSSYKDISKEKLSKTKYPINNKEDFPILSQNLLTVNLFSSNIKNDSSFVVASNNNDHKQFEIITKLFNHYYWQSIEFKKNVSIQCANDIDAYLLALNNNIQWALKAFDSSGHYRGQVFYRNVIWIGEKMFCEEINFENLKSNNRNFEFGFFVARFQLKFPGIIDPIIQLGECLPKSCTSKDVEIILNEDPNVKLLLQQNKLKNSSLSFNESSIIKILDVRSIPGEYSFQDDIIFQSLCGICLVLLTIVIIATIYEATLDNTMKTHNEKDLEKSIKKNSKQIKVFSIQDVNGKATTEVYHMDTIKNNNINNNNNNNNNNNINPENVGNIENRSKLKAIENDSKLKKLKIHQKLLLCFSLESNGNTILSMNKKDNEDNISCIHGIRVLSLFWIIMVHTYLQVFQIGENRFLRNISEKTIIYQIIGNATFSVDSFFFISGLLVCFLFLKHHKSSNQNKKEFISQGTIQTFIMIFYRYIRLTPTYLFIIFFHHITVKYVFSNSVFYYPTNVVDHVTCSKYWWRNILYINNWYPFKDLCMIWSWYLSNDMQFYIIATILLIFSTKYFKATVIILGTILLTSWGTSGIFSLYFNYTHKVSDPFESFDYLYDKPWQRIGPHIIGMVTGYIIYKCKNPPRITTTINLLLWFISIAMNSIIIFGVWEGELDLLTTAFYVSIGHSAWALGLVWITLSCCWKLANPINTFLSYRGFLPFSRLTYCMYLIHPTIMMAIANHMQGPIHLDHLMIFIIFLGNIVMTFLIALIISLFFEAPIIRLLKVIFSK